MADCAGTTFAVLFAGVFVLLPAYNRQYSLRECLRNIPRTPALPVVCYPQRWDAVSYYLPRPMFAPLAQTTGAPALEEAAFPPRYTLVGENRAVAYQLLRDLPDSVEFVGSGRRGAIAAGWVRICGPRRRMSYSPKNDSILLADRVH